MTGEYRVDPEALRRFSRGSAERAERLRRIRAELGGHQLPADAFGKLPEAAAVGRDYRERTEAALDNLTSAADTTEQIGEHTERTARTYEQAEQETVEALTAVAAGLGG
ncbi:hypothetical protein CFP65_1669 [Kitasatospora sp. MMS16-BH015]|uniref:hypothetical protein n=1 Tax=Kitasatospora sp. MMS16-BH015 TaxID=2018025 RepID=UPI000CA38A7A|nr:hypothetical protein [Kitasatospora sp. MMS16-BH015]AUG76552.1 hypothetical protein CFP65_1669 [Kitasatospora sp. MMS16-BH015]